MGAQLFKNNAAATLNGTISIGGTTLNLGSGQGARFPSPSAGDYFLITLYEKDGGGAEINYEVVACTARTADALTITRDYEGIVVAAGGTSGGWAYPAAVGINPSQVVYIEMRATAYLFGNVLYKDGNLAGLASPATARTNLGAEGSANKDAPGGYAGLTLFKLNMRNVANTFTSWFTNTNTAARTYTLKDADGTIAFISDITGTNSGTNTGDETGPRVAALNHAASVKGSLVDADEITGQDSAASFGLIRTTWTSVKAFLKTYFDTLYASLAGNTFTGAQIYGDQVLSRGMTKDMGIVFLDKGNSGTSAQTCDYTAGSHQKLTVTGAFTLNAVTNWPPTGNLGELLLELVNGASSVVTWPTINWVKSDGSFTTTFASNGVTLQASGTDWVMLWSRDAGTTVYGKIMR